MKLDDQAAHDYLYGRLNYERSDMPRNPGELRLGRMRRLLRALGDPQRDLRIVHITGTKGKGSTAHMIAAALSATGVKTGLFCSPHIHRLAERFRIDGVEPTAATVTSLVDAIRPVVEALDSTDPHPRRRDLTFFELTTAMGLLHFARQGCGAVVLEVGLGGRLDSTNVVRPLVSTITSISFDHTKQLGSTLSSIATEKAGIIKRSGRAVVGVREEEPRRAIQRIASQRRASVRWIDVDFRESFLPPSPPIRTPDAGRVEVRTWQRDWGVIDLPLYGRHQAANAATALATLDALGEAGLEVGPDAVRAGFASLRVDVRVEVVSRNPWVVIDGAHNVASARALAVTLRENFPAVPRTLIFGTTRDKDLRGQLAELLPRFGEVIATRYLNNPRAVEPEAVASVVRELGGPEPWISTEPAEAFNLARRLTPETGLICVTGSMFLAAEAKSVALGLDAPADRRPATV